MNENLEENSAIVVILQFLNHFEDITDESDEKLLNELREFRICEELKTQYKVGSDHFFYGLAGINHFYHPINILKSLGLNLQFYSKTAKKYLVAPQSELNNNTLFLKPLNKSSRKIINALVKSQYTDKHLVSIIFQDKEGFYEFAYKVGSRWCTSNNNEQGQNLSTSLKGFTALLSYFSHSNSSPKILIYRNN